MICSVAAGKEGAIGQMEKFGTLTAMYRVVISVSTISIIN